MRNKKTKLQNARSVLFNDMELQDTGQKINAVEDFRNLNSSRTSSTGGSSSGGGASGGSSGGY